MMYIEDKDNIKSAIFQSHEELECDYEFEVIDDEELSSIILNIRRKDSKEYLGTLCTVEYGEQNDNPSVVMWKSYITSNNENNFGDIKFQYELPELPK